MKFKRHESLLQEIQVPSRVFFGEHVVLFGFETCDFHGVNMLLKRSLTAVRHHVFLTTFYSSEALLP